MPGISARPDRLISNTDIAPQGGVTVGVRAAQDTELPIGQRTRARNPLRDITIEELEAMLLEDETFHSDGEDDEAYQQFLQVRERPPRTACLRGTLLACTSS